MRYITTTDMKDEVVDWTNIDKSDFSLTYDMCEKNDYGGFDNTVFMDILRSQEIKEPLAIVIYTHTGSKQIKIYSFEVNKKYRKTSIGRKLINGYCSRYDLVELSTFPETKIFYEKCLLHEEGDGHMVWRRGEKR